MFAMASNIAMCTMEYVYFSRPDSNINGINVHTARKNLGKQLAFEAPIEGDVVTGVPDSSISVAIGYAEASGIPYEMGLIKNRYVGRTFIQPSQSLREQGCKNEAVSGTRSCRRQESHHGGRLDRSRNNKQTDRHNAEGCRCDRSSCADQFTAD